MERKQTERKPKMAMASFYKRFKFVKPFDCRLGHIDAGRELTVYDGQILFDGGLIEPQYYEFFKELIKKEMETPNYLREYNFVTNYKPY